MPVRRQPLVRFEPGRTDKMQMDGAAGGHGYQVVSVALPTDLVEALVRRVGPNGLSLYIAQALRRQEPLAALL
nr:hypothetical protein [Micromonospora sp. DSM 115978]